MTATPKAQNDVVITGIGMVTALGVGADATWQMLANGAAPVFDAERFAPYTVHPLPEIDWSTQMSRRDQRQMETWQRIGTYTAGLALEDAGIKGDENLTATMDMIIAAAGGERDIDVDTMILSGVDEGDVDAGVLINEKLTTELRPTLFLAQLSNLMAGNISIVHKVTGSSRTFMGGEGAGIAAVETAAARIRSGQSTHALVGAANNFEQSDMLLSHEIDQHLMQGGWAPVWQRDHVDGGGIISGSGGAFLVLESRAHAQARGAKIYARIDDIKSDQGSDTPEGLSNRLNTLSSEIDFRSIDILISCASGHIGKTATEKDFLSSTLANVPVRGIASALGHMTETQFPLGIALAALSAFHGKPIEQIDSRFETSTNIEPHKIGVLTVGHQMAEGMAIVTSEKGDI